MRITSAQHSFEQRASWPWLPPVLLAGAVSPRGPSDYVPGLSAVVPPHLKTKDDKCLDTEGPPTNNHSSYQNSHSLSMHIWLKSVNFVPHCPNPYCVYFPPPLGKKKAWTFLKLKLSYPGTVLHWSCLPHCYSPTSISLLLSNCKVFLPHHTLWFIVFSLISINLASSGSKKEIIWLISWYLPLELWNHIIRSWRQLASN